MNENLAGLRRDISKVNHELLEKLNERILLVEKIAALKDATGLDYFDAVREEEMLEELIGHYQGPLSKELVRQIFLSIFASSLQHMGLKRNKNLLISAGQDEGFLSIHQMFGIEPGQPAIIAGPCAVEGFDRLKKIAALLKKRGVGFLRGGAYKPRTSPYAFQGLGEKGLKMLHQVGKEYGLITITEVVDTRDVELVSTYSDILQIGARNMNNFELLKEVGQTQHPILLKRGMSSTIQEFMYAAEYIGLKGNRKIILCERGIRTFETKTRNTLDLSSVPIIKKETSLPIIVDISHSLGRKDIVCELTKAALAVGADGFMIEVHPCPELALSDSKQQLSPEEFLALLDDINYKG